LPGDFQETRRTLDREDFTACPDNLREIDGGVAWSRADVDNT